MLYYIYDDSSNISGFKYNNDIYYYQKNYQNDITGIYDSNYNLIVEYTYDTWGRVLSITDANDNIIIDVNHIGVLNPFRYRSYYYDEETGFYYVSNRYYNPEICRFVNSDSQLNTSLGVLGCNMFAYCLNNPVNKVDYNGNKPRDSFYTMDEAARDAAEYLGKLSWKNTWEDSTMIYSYTKTIKTYKTVTTEHSFLWWKWTMTSTKTVKTDVTIYTYKIVRTDKNPYSVGVPKAPWFKEKAAGVHTHPMGSGMGITQFSPQDKKWADYQKIPVYVYGPNGILRKYDPTTGDDVVIYDDLPKSEKKPWKR